MSNLYLNWTYIFVSICVYVRVFEQSMGGFFCVCVCFFYGVLPWVNHWEASHGKGWWGWGERKAFMFLFFGPYLAWKRKLSSSPLDQWKSEDSGKAANRPLLDRSEARWDSSLQSKRLIKGCVWEILNSLFKSLFSRYQNDCFETSNCLGIKMHFKQFGYWNAVSYIEWFE